MTQDLQFVDADSHVEEHPAIWERLDPAFRDRRPVPIDNPNIPGRPQRDVQWFIDGQLFPRLTGYGATCHGSPPLTSFARRKPVSVECQGLVDVDARLRDMDAAGLDISVVYPTLFLQTVTKDLVYEAALMRAYNDFLADRCARSQGRVRWAAPVPVRNVPAAVDELRRTREMGAVGAMMLGTAGDTLLHERVFDPFWEVAQELGVPVCIHVGWAHDSLLASCDSPAAALLLCLEQSQLKAFFSFTAGGILERFPGLKVGLIEAPLDWFPVMLERMSHWRATPTAHPWPVDNPAEHYMRERDLYFTAEGDEENLPELLELFGEDRIMGSQDFPHVHFEGGRIGEGFQDLRKRDDISEEARRKLLVDNAQRFYRF